MKFFILVSLFAHCLFAQIRTPEDLPQVMKEVHQEFIKTDRSLLPYFSPLYVLYRKLKPINEEAAITINTTIDLLEKVYAFREDDVLEVKEKLFDVYLGEKFYIEAVILNLNEQLNSYTEKNYSYLKEYIYQASESELSNDFKENKWIDENLIGFNVIITNLMQLIRRIQGGQFNEGPLFQEENNQVNPPLEFDETPPVTFEQKTPEYTPSPETDSCQCEQLESEWELLTKAYEAFSAKLKNNFVGCIDLTQDIYRNVFLKVKPKCWGPGIAWRFSIIFNKVFCWSNFQHNAFLLYPKNPTCSFKDDMVFDPYILSEGQTRAAKIEPLTQFVLQGDCGGGERDTYTVTWQSERSRAQQCINSFGHDPSFCQGAYTCLNKEYGYNRPEGKRKSDNLKNTCP